MKIPPSYRPPRFPFPQPPEHRKDPADPGHDRFGQPKVRHDPNFDPSKYAWQYMKEKK